MTAPASRRLARLAAVVLCALCVADARTSSIAAAQKPARGLDLSSGTHTARRMALVVGNAAYATGPLKNPANDATDMAVALREAGFEVTLGTNWTKRQMEDAVAALAVKLKRGGVGLFYYAGHGMQVAGRNYLIPIGCQIESERDVPYEAVDASRVLGTMAEADNGMNVMVLDACRNNPFARSFRTAAVGLAQMEAPKGVYIAFATAPGSVASDGSGRNGTYTAALLKALRRPGFTIEEVFKRVRSDVLRSTANKQLSWDLSSLEGNFYFIAPGSSAAAKTGAAVPEDQVAWHAIEASKDVGDFEDFIDRFPNSGYVPLAESRRDAIRRPSQPGAGSAGRKPSRPSESISILIAGAVVLDLGPPPVVNLYVTGQGWTGASNVKIYANGHDVTEHLVDQNDNMVSLKATLGELNLRNGLNEVWISVDGAESSVYSFRKVFDRR